MSKEKVKVKEPRNQRTSTASSDLTFIPAIQLFLIGKMFVLPKKLQPNFSMQPNQANKQNTQVAPVNNQLNQVNNPTQVLFWVHASSIKRC